MPQVDDDDDDDDDVRDTYIINLVMAISLSTAARSKQKSAQSFATGLFQTALMHVSATLTNDLGGL